MVSHLSRFSVNLFQTDTATATGIHEDGTEIHRVEVDVVRGGNEMTALTDALRTDIPPPTPSAGIAFLPKLVPLPHLLGTHEADTPLVQTLELAPDIDCKNLHIQFLLITVQR